MILALLASAAADPLALRAPGLDADGGLAGSATVSGPALSAGAWLPSGLGLAAELDLAGGPLGASVGMRRSFRGASGFGVDLVGAAGLSMPLAAPAAVLTVTPSVTAGWRGPRLDATLGLVAPVAARVAPDPALSVPVRLEPWLGVHAGPGTFGIGAAAAYVATTGERWAVDLRWMLSFSVHEPGPTPARPGPPTP